MEDKKSGTHWGNWVFGAIIGALVVGAIFGNVVQVIANSALLVLFAAGFVVHWVVLKVWAQYKTPAVVASTVDSVVEPKAQSVSAPVTATQPIQQINKTVVASVVAGVVTVAGCFYLFAVVSANQAYDRAVTEHDQAVTEHDQAVAAHKNMEAEIDAMVSAALGVKSERLPAGLVKEPDYDPSPEKMDAEIHELAMIAAAGVKTDRLIQPPSCCKDTEYALEKAKVAKRYPLASLFNKADVE
ncbi:MAG: hypothetical protein B7Z35_15120 [Hydrogenophilales bacterium 12-61-10]|nr:MAG: hypothetical protein B7Z35_15120 [Hydrogenophilales bacterium 12-61-10]OYX27401.1 MAG: hypothetical protein B7Z03_13785 [Hydrogenophilales bacterium 32-62-9]